MKSVYDQRRGAIGNGNNRITTVRFHTGLVALQVAAITAVFGLASPTWAEDHEWNVASGDWDVPDNWLPVGVPIFGDTATIDNNGTTFVTTPAFADQLGVGIRQTGFLEVTSGNLGIAGDVRVGDKPDSDGHVKVLTNTSVLGVVAGDVSVGLDGKGTLDILGGGRVDVGSGDFTLAKFNDSKGFLTISGTSDSGFISSTMSIQSGKFIVAPADMAQGVVVVEDGGELFTEGGELGDPASQQFLTAFGAEMTVRSGSTWDARAAGGKPIQFRGNSRLVVDGVRSLVRGDSLDLVAPKPSPFQIEVRKQGRMAFGGAASFETLSQFEGVFTQAPSLVVRDPNSTFSSDALTLTNANAAVGDGGTIRVGDGQAPIQLNNGVVQFGELVLRRMEGPGNVIASKIVGTGEKSRVDFSHNQISEAFLFDLPVEGTTGITARGEGKTKVVGVHNRSGETVVMDNAQLEIDSFALGSGDVVIKDHGFVKIVGPGPVPGEIRFESETGILEFTDRLGQDGIVWGGTTGSIDGIPVTDFQITDLDGPIASSGIRISISGSHPAKNDFLRRSGAVTVTGIDGQVFVLEITIPKELLEDLDNIQVGWFDPDKGEWVKATDGNSSKSPGVPDMPIDDGYDPWNSQSGLGLPGQLGATGFDPLTGTAWAVLDHNSQFALIAVPEPATALLLLLGGGVAIGSRRR